ncbi:hypothetical protein HJC23_007986 [Cyclotella cryptica]|uniref:Magnesium-dependent phosphatase-1 n=1 Tax=Cyclotella cryptica TaxID=29204 RepID=A0ABD3P7W5_9STRA|eukprot:CCRYP_016969-RA/>CCRYP_016969-RA protein AED:0.24 eAED:0.24 QI:0/-1/0/1/-1/1/1/0/255
MGKGSSSGSVPPNQHASCSTTESSETSNNNAYPHSLKSDESDLPSIIVFDLDDCLWTPEMHELSGPPSIPIEGPLDPNNPIESPLGTVGMGVSSSRRKKRGVWADGYTPDQVVELYHGARLALRELAINPKYRNVQIAVASTSLVPEYSRSCMAGIEIVEGVTMKDMISYAQIGRNGKLSSSKTSHFELIHQESGVSYEDILFFDDCNWDDHVGCLKRTFGVVGMRTPNGLSLEEFHRGLQKFSVEKKRRDGTLN